ncbi:WD40 repeat-like protein [Rhizopogon vinicolor AM-OR11-026]|uniref:WD40 repeat-like protein n=1 Tax=Rhizopogon vinicolor AM-OR11-026 TaxID=1314800 RepID=A0A1B7MRN0_9AGAM|nr:WD40 repeat-like protein [Rhizopogon vinicolor AM-OR11-026]
MPRMPSPGAEMKNTQAIKPHQTMRGHADAVTAVAHLPGGRRIITSSLDGSLRLWDLEMGTQIGDAWRDDKDETGVCTIALSPNGKMVASGSGDGTVRLWDVETRKVIAKWGSTKNVCSVGWSADGKRVVSGSGDRTVRVWDVKSGKLALGPIKTGHGYMYAVIYSPDTRKIATGGFNQNAIKIWNATTGKLLSTIEHKHSVRSLAWSSDQKKLISGSFDLIRIFDTATWKEIAILEGRTGVVYSLSLFQNDRLLASASDKKTARLWNLDTNLPVGPPLHHEYHVKSAAISDDGKRVVTGCGDKNAYVWNVETILRYAGLEDLLSIPYVIARKLLAVETSQQETHTSSLHPTSTSDPSISSKFSFSSAPSSSSNTTASILYPTSIARNVHRQRTSHQFQQNVTKCKDDEIIYDPSFSETCAIAPTPSRELAYLPSDPLLVLTNVTSRSTESNDTHDELCSGQLGEGNPSANISYINDKNVAPSHRIRLVPHFFFLRFEPISCDLRDGDTPLRIGRFIDCQAVNPVATDKLAFKSKTVSWAHAEIWSDNGKINIKDTKSSGGTFVNHLRLSPADSESIPHQLKDGDIVQLGVDYQDHTGEVHKSVKFTIEIGRESQVPTNDFNSSSDPTAYFDTPASAHSTSNYEEEENEWGEDNQNEEVQCKTCTPPYSNSTATEEQTRQESTHASDSLQDLTDQLQGRSNYPITSGGFGDIWKCELVKLNETVQVAVKTIRAFESDNDDLMRKNSRVSLLSWRTSL